MTATTGIWPGFLSARERTLYGGFTCELTCDELNEWTELLRKERLWHEILVQESEEKRRENACRIGKITDAELITWTTDSTVKKADLQEQCYDLAKEWYAGIQKRRAEARDKEVAMRAEAIQRIETETDKK